MTTNNLQDILFYQVIAVDLSFNFLQWPAFNTTFSRLISSTLVHPPLLLLKKWHYRRNSSTFSLLISFILALYSPWKLTAEEGQHCISRRETYLTPGKWNRQQAASLVFPLINQKVSTNGTTSDANNPFLLFDKFQLFFLWCSHIDLLNLYVPSCAKNINCQITKAYTTYAAEGLPLCSP